MTMLLYSFPNYFSCSFIPASTFSALQVFTPSPSSLHQKHSFSCFKIAPSSLVRNRVPVVCFSSLQGVVFLIQSLYLILELANVMILLRPDLEVLIVIFAFIWVLWPVFHTLDAIILVLLVCNLEIQLHLNADDMGSTTGTSLYPSHRCKTIHLVGAKIYFIHQIWLRFSFWEDCMLKILHVGEACSGYSQCSRGKGLWCLQFLRLFWCTPYSTRLAAGFHHLIFCFIIHLDPMILPCVFHLIKTWKFFNVMFC